MSEELPNCSTCSSIAERAKLINDLIRNQHELVNSLIHERRASSSARTIVAELKRQNEFLSQECNKISEEYKIALEKVSPLEKRAAEIESDLNAKKVEIESYRVQLEIAQNAPKISSEADAQISQMQLNIDQLENKVRRHNTQKRQCTRALKNLIRVKSSLGNDEAVHAIESLESTLGVSLDPLEQQAIEIERILQNEQGSEKKINEEIATRAESSSQTETVLQTHRMCQTSALSMRSRECQTETKSDMPTFDCGDPVIHVGGRSNALAQTVSVGTSDAQEQNAKSDNASSSIAIAQDSSTGDFDLGMTLAVNTSQLESAGAASKDDSRIDRRPVSLLECIPKIPVISDGEDSISPIPECSLVPRKTGKHVSFRDDESFVPIDPAAADSGDGRYKDMLGDDSDAKIMEEVELILAEMRNPFGDPNQRLLAVSPMPPSPVPTRRKKKKKKDKSDHARKQLVHQNSIGFEPNPVAPFDNMPSSPVFAAQPTPSRLKADVTHNADIGLTTFSFQMPSSGTSKLSLEFDQLTKHVTLSCSDQNLGSQINKNDCAPVPRILSSSTGDVPRRTSFGFPVPPEPPKGSEELSMTPLFNREDEPISVELPKAGSHRSLDINRDSADDIGGKGLPENFQADLVESRHAKAENRVSCSTLSEVEEEAGSHSNQPSSSSLGGKIPPTLKKDYRLKRLSKRRKSEPLVKEFQRRILKKSIDANIMEAKEKMLQRRIQLAPQTDSLELSEQATQSESRVSAISDVAPWKDRVSADNAEAMQQAEIESVRSCSPETDAPESQVEQQEIPHIQLDGTREEPEVEIIACGLDTTLAWELRTWDGKEHIAVDGNSERKDSDDEEESMFIDFEDDDLKTPLSPPEVTVVDRSCTKVIPQEFIEEILSNAVRTAPESEPHKRLVTPPTSPPPFSGSPSMITRGKSKLIPSSPVSAQSIEKPNTRSSNRASSKVEEISTPSIIAPLSIESPPPRNKVQITPVIERMTTRRGKKIVSLLKDSYVPEKEVYETDKLFGYDDVIVSKKTKQAATEQTTSKRDSMQTIVGYFKQKEGRFASIEETLRKVSTAQVTMNEALTEIRGLEHLRKLYVSFVHVLLDINKKLEVQTQSQITEAERNLVTFFLQYVPQMEKYEGKTNHCVGFNCINFIRAYLMSPDRSNKTFFELASLWKVISLVASEIQGETLQLYDEIYYAIADHSDEAAYLIGCVLAGWPLCLKGIKVDSPFGFVVRYVLFHHTSTVPLDDLQTARAMALQAGWAPLIQEERSLGEAIERFAPSVFSKENETKFLSRLSLQSLEVMLVILGDVNKAKNVIEEYVPKLLGLDGLPDRDVNSLLQLCGKVWTKFAGSKSESIPFVATVECLIDLEARLRNANRKEVLEFCNKALWSYANYDSSEVGTRARQKCTKERIVQRKAMEFSRGKRGARGAGKRGGRGRKSVQKKKKMKQNEAQAV